MGKQSLLHLHRHLLYSMQFQRIFPPLGYHFPFASNHGFMGNFPFRSLPGQFRLGKDRNENFSTRCTTNESGTSFSTGESDHQSEHVVFSEPSEIRSGQVQCKYEQEKTKIVLLGYQTISLDVPQNQFSSVHLFAFINYNYTNYDNNHAFGRQSRKLFCLFKGLP